MQSLQPGSGNPVFGFFLLLSSVALSHLCPSFSFVFVWSDQSWSAVLVESPGSQVRTAGTRMRGGSPRSGERIQTPFPASQELVFSAFDWIALQTCVVAESI